VIEPSISGLHDLQRAYAVVQKFDLKAFVIINKFDINPEMSREIGLWCRQQEIFVAGHLPFENQVVVAMVSGFSIIEFAPEREISKQIKASWTKILN